MTPAEWEIAELDASLADVGEDITLKRVSGPLLSVVVSCECRAFVRGYQPDELVGGIMQTDKKVIMSPTQIIAKGWPGPGALPLNDEDRRVPKKGDKVVIQGRAFNIENNNGGIYVGGELVRIELQARG